MVYFLLIMASHLFLVGPLFPAGGGRVEPPLWLYPEETALGELIRTIEPDHVESATAIERLEAFFTEHQTSLLAKESLTKLLKHVPAKKDIDYLPTGVAQAIVWSRLLLHCYEAIKDPGQKGEVVLFCEHENIHGFLDYFFKEFEEIFKRNPKMPRIHAYFMKRLYREVCARRTAFQVALQHDHSGGYSGARTRTVDSALREEDEE